jgi:hypothetical protein
MKAAIGYIHPPFVVARFMRSVLELLAADAGVEKVFENRVIAVPSSPYLNLGRNQVAAAFLDRYPPEVEILLSLDTDQSFRPSQARRLIALVNDRRPLVSGLYYAQTENLRYPIVLRRSQINDGFDIVGDFAENSLEEVDLVGMGFCAIHRSLLEQWRIAHGDTWFDFGKRPSGKFMAEDEAFCREVQQLGHKIYVHTGLVVGHYKLGDTARLPDSPE